MPGRARLSHGRRISSARQAHGQSVYMDQCTRGADGTGNVAVM